jgi:hypothetical protein
MVCAQTIVPSGAVSYFEKAVPWLKRLVVGLSTGKPGFATGSVHMGLVVKKVTSDRYSPKI